MNTQYRFTLPLLVLLMFFSAACGSHQIRFSAPVIDPPADLIPSYIPAGLELVSGFQIPYGGVGFSMFSDGERVSLIHREAGSDPFFVVKSPNGNDLQGVYYQGKGHFLLITKSYFPGGNLDIWHTLYRASGSNALECDCMPLRLGVLSFGLDRFVEVEEERTIAETQVAILKGPMGHISVFVKGDCLLAVEGDISLEENLKIVTSLIEP
jgi:hypothetical protein